MKIVKLIVIIISFLSSSCEFKDANGDTISYKGETYDVTVNDELGKLKYKGIYQGSVKISVDRTFVIEGFDLYSGNLMNFPLTPGDKISIDVNYTVLTKKERDAKLITPLEKLK